MRSREAHTIARVFVEATMVRVCGVNDLISKTTAPVYQANTLIK